MIPRDLAPRLREAARRYPVVTVTGPRQSGKTTLVRSALRGWRYVSLEDPDTRAFALADPRGFLGQSRGRTVLDEVQRAPALFSYIQGIVDAQRRPGQFVLSGSRNFLLAAGVSQTLAGRTRILHLLPLARSELTGRKPLAPDRLGEAPNRGVGPPAESLETVLWTGGYPAIHGAGLPARQWLADYYQTYLQRDVRDVVNVGDLEAFDRFMRLSAGRVGQLLNLSSLASDCGVTHSTARRWMSVLEVSFIVLRLQPWYRNLGKRLVKSPKLYFLDTGLLCYLLGIRRPDELAHHALRGAVFESFVVSEVLKAFVHSGEVPAMGFFRDATGHEVDLLVETRTPPVAVEIKSGRTVAGDFLDGLRYWRTLKGNAGGGAALVYGGDQAARRDDVAVRPWFAL